LKEGKGDGEAANGSRREDRDSVASRRKDVLRERRKLPGQIAALSFDAIWDVLTSENRARLLWAVVQH
jgi:hypothetical protein